MNWRRWLAALFVGVRWQQCWPDGAIGQLDVILVTSFAFQPRHGMPSFQTALGHGIEPSLSVDVECNMTANMFSIMRATFTLQRALVNERSLAAEQNLPPLITCRQVIEMATIAGARAAHLDRKIGLERRTADYRRTVAGWRAPIRAKSWDPGQELASATKR